MISNSPYARMCKNFEVVRGSLVLFLRVWTRIYCREQDWPFLFIETIANMMVLLKKSVAFELETDSARMSLRAVMSVSLARWCQRRCSGGRGWQRASGMGFESEDE